jgi:S1-C subfamily serine protease
MFLRKGVSRSYWTLLIVAVILTALITYSSISIVSVNPTGSGQPPSALTITQTEVSVVPGGPVGLDPVAIYSKDSASVVTVQGVLKSVLGVTPVLGSGFVYAYKGSSYVITNFHVVHGIDELTVTFQDGNAYPANVVGTDAYSDLGVVSVAAPASEFHPLQVVSSSSLKVGQPVVAIGNPFGLAGSMTVGIISQLGRTITESMAGPFPIANVIQFSAPINPGNSGGPLLSGNGTVIGITTATVASSQGVGFAIPSDAILRETPSLIQTGKYTGHPYMGVSTADMNYQLSKLQGTNVTYGALIQNVTAGSPAAKAGLRGGDTVATVQGVVYSIGGDIIIGINGTKIANTDALSSYLQEFASPGQTAQVQIVRGGSAMTVTLVFGTRPPAPSG